MAETNRRILKMSLDFNNTEIAFRSKNNRDLKWAYRLFSLIGNNALVKVGNGAARFALAINFPMGWAIKPTIYRQFVGGESIDKCAETVRNLVQFNVKAILDYSVEGTDELAGIESTLKETLYSIRNAAKEENIPFAVFKPTAFTTSSVLKKASANKASLTEEEAKEAQNFRNRINTLCAEAHKLNIPILIDAEDVWYQNYIDEVVEEMMTLYNKEKPIVFNTWQMYRHDRLEHLKQWFDRARKGNYYVGAKFVRGAYMEKERARAHEAGVPSPIQPNKEATDKDYNAALEFCVENIDRCAIFNGTHNEYSSEYLTKLMAEKGLEKADNRIWFSQLYGMSDHISFNLGEAGYNVAKYLPYGPVKHVLPYLLRRVEENTSVEGQTSRELSLILTEKKRRGI